MNDRPDVSIIIVNWNSTADTIHCISSIRQHTRQASYEVIVVDNASTQGDPKEIIASHPEVVFIASAENVGFARGNNLALPTAQGRHVLFLNPDTLLKNDAISTMVRFLDTHPVAGVCGGRLYNRDGSPGTSYGNFPTFWHVVYRALGLKGVLPKSMEPLYGRPFDPTLQAPLPVDWVSGANLCIQKAILADGGGFDPDYFFSFDDVDLCYQAKQRGYGVYFVPDAEIYHLGGNSFKGSGSWFRVYFYTSEFIFFKKHSKYSAAVYGLNWLQWSIKYLKRSIRKRKQRETYARLLSNLLAVQKGKAIPSSKL